ncbi:MAG: hypothetical protein ACT4TC_05215 [Myxococcaceae bacterium]
MRRGWKRSVDQRGFDDFTLDQTVINAMTVEVQLVATGGRMDSDPLGDY